MVEKKETKETKPEKKDRYEGFHQPEILGVVDNVTGEIIPIKSKSDFESNIGEVRAQAHEWNLLDELSKRL
jgi:hypothetical protein